MVFNEGVDFRRVRRPGEGQGEFRSPVRFADVADVPDIAVVDELVAWYRFADNSNTAIDYTAEVDDDRFADTTAFDGTVNGASFVQNGGVRDVVSGAGTNSGAYDFDGVDDFIQIPHQTELGFIGDSAYSFCCYANDRSNNNAVVTKQTDNNQIEPLKIIITSDVIETAYGNNGFADFGSLSAPKPSGLTHITVTHDGQDTRQLFVNGVFEGSTSTPTTDFSNQEPITLGKRFRSGGSFAGFLDGIIDDVRLYNRALSASEINQIYTNTDPDQ
jgi:hypothetical protein